MEIKLPPQAVELIHRLEAHGYEGYAVGGCVRDSLLGKEPHDWDICTSARPDEMSACFAGEKVIPTGLRHGTLTVLKNHVPYEVTTYRVDGTYTDCRRPDQVTFVRNLREDLARRDFTMNAMAYHPREGLVDCFGGQEDLEKRIIRAVGDPEERFSEDALRILRALRFASTLGFSVEKETAAAAHAKKKLLEKVAAERIFSELVRLICGSGALPQLLKFPDVLGVFLPELLPSLGLIQQNPHHIYTVWEHTARALSYAPPDPVLRLTMLFHDLGKPASMTVDEAGVGHFYGHDQVSRRLCAQALARLRSDNDTKAQVDTLIQYHDADFAAGRRGARRWLSRLGERTLRQLLEVKRADCRAQAPAYLEENLCSLEAFERNMEEVLAQQECFSIKDLAVDGTALMQEAGYPPGPAIGKALNALLDGVLEERMPNEKAELLERARLYRETNF